MRIYAEWFIDGQFDNGIFTTWAEYFAATFNPEIIINKVEVLE